MREQQAQITGAFIGPTELLVEAIVGPRQHNDHCHGWLWNRYLEDAKLRAAAVREEGLRIIARRRNEQIVEAILPSYEEALQNAEMARVLFDASNALPSAEQAKLNNFMGKIGKLIDAGKSEGIDVDYLNPLIDSMKRLSENVITHQPAKEVA